MRLVPVLKLEEREKKACDFHALDATLAMTISAGMASGRHMASLAHRSDDRSRTMNHTSIFESAPALAGDTMVLTSREGLLQLSDIADGIAEGQMRPVSLKVRGDDEEEIVTGIVNCGVRSAYRVMLENGMTFVGTYNSGVVTARNRHSSHHQRTIEFLEEDDTVVMPRGRMRLGAYDGRSWSESMLDRGAFPKEVLAGSNGYLRKVIRKTLLQPVGQMGEGIRSSLSIDSQNAVTLTWAAPNKWLARQLHTLLVPFANVAGTLDANGTTMTVTDADLVRLDDATDLIDGIYEEGDCDVDRQVVDWLLGIVDMHVRAREVIRVDNIEGVNKREMYALVLERRDGTFLANGTLHTGIRNPERLGLEEVNS